MKNSFLIFLGFVTGILSAYLGIGGGVIIVPVLTVLFKYPIKRSIATSLAALPLIAITGVFMHVLVWRVNISFFVVICISLGAIMGARIGVFLTNIIRSRYIKLIFVIFLIYAGMKQFSMWSPDRVNVLIPLNIYFMLFLGVVTGMASSLLGIGGGAIVVPALNLFFGIFIHEAIAVSLSVIIPTSIAGVYFHFKNGNIDFLPVKYILPGAVLGAVIGSVLSNLSSADIIHKVLGVVLLFLACKMVFSCWQDFGVKKVRI